MAIITTSVGVLDDGNILPYIPVATTSAATTSADSATIYDDFPEGAFFTPTGWVPLEDVSKSLINSVATSSVERQAMVAADGAVLRLIYGRQRVGAQIAYLKEYQNYIYVVAIWCLGEINSVEEIYFDGSVADGTFIVKVADYVGTDTQTYDSTLHSIDANYIDDLVLTKGTDDIGVAYSVLKIHASSFPSRIEAIIQGKKVQNAAQSALIYTTNPSLCLVDYIESPIYGQGKTVNAASIVTASDANDEIIPTTSDKRRELNLVIDRQAKTGTHIEVLRTYAGCFVINRGDEVKLVPNVATSSTRTLTNTDIIDGTMKITKAGNNNLPTVMKIIYTDTTADPWKDGEAVVKARGVDIGTTPWRESTVQLQGITSHEQAYREGVERLNKLMINDLGVEFQSFDERLQDEVGDVITVSHYYGLTSKKLRVLSVDPVSPGRWKIVAKEYNANTFSDDVETTADSPDTTIPLPGNPVAVTNVTPTEVVTEELNGAYTIRIKTTWTAADYPFVDDYYIKIYLSGAKVYESQIDSNETEHTSAPLTALGTYSVRMSTISNGQIADASDETVVVDGIADAAYPEDPTDLVIDQKGTTVGVFVGIYTGTSVWKTAVKKEPKTANPDWDTATDVGIADSNSYIETDVAADEYTYLVKSVRSDGVESENFLSQDVTVSSTEEFDYIAGELEGGTSYGGTFVGIFDNASGDLNGGTTIDGGTTLGALAAGTGNKTYAQDAEPSSGMDSGDLWIDTNDGNKLYRYSGSAWVDLQDDDIGAAQSTADGKVVTFAQTSTPTAEGIGDLWIDTDDGNKLYRWNGSNWIDTQDTSIADAQATADGKIVTFYQDGVPTTGAEGDLWVDTNNDNKLYLCNGATCNSINAGEWESARDGTIATAQSAAEAAQASADGKIVTFYTTSTPTTQSDGDLWYSSSTDQFKRWDESGSSWETVATLGAEFGTDITGSISAADVTSFIDANTFTATTVPTLFATAAIDEAYIGDLTASKITTGTLGASVVYANDIEANQIQSGSLASGVIYTGTLNANQVTTGSIGAIDISATTGTFSGTVTSLTQMSVIQSAVNGPSAIFTHSDTGKSASTGIECSGKQGIIATGTSKPAVHGSGQAIGIYGIITGTATNEKAAGFFDKGTGDYAILVDGDIVPDSSASSILGESGEEFDRLYVDDIKITGGIEIGDVDGSSGTNWIKPSADGYGQVGASDTYFGSAYINAVNVGTKILRTFDGSVGTLSLTPTTSWPGSGSSQVTFRYGFT